MLVKIANRDNPDQTASSEAQLVFEILDHLLKISIYLNLSFNIFHKSSQKFDYASDY